MRLLARLLAVALALWLGVIRLDAQEPNAPVGVQIGYSRADLGGPDGQALAGRQGAFAGVYLTGHVRHWLAVQPELNFTLKGGRTVAQLQGGGTAPLDIELAYLQAPLMLRFSALEGRGRIHPVVFGGPAPALRIGCDLELALDDQQLRAPCDAASSFPFRRIDLGVVIGGGLQFDWAQTALAVEARYDLGVSSIFGSDADVRNRAFAVLLALNF